VKLHLPELLAAGGGTSTHRKSKLVAFDATVQTPNSSIGDILITAPFQHRIVVRRAKPQKNAKRIGHGMLHPLHRALAMEKVLAENPHLSPRAFALREGLSTATVCQWRKLLRLCPAVRQALLKINDRATAWRCSIRRLLPLAALPPARQCEAFQKFANGRRRCRHGAGTPISSLTQSSA
jgi:hypothetical protein